MYVKKADRAVRLGFFFVRQLREKRANTARMARRVRYVPLCMKPPVLTNDNKHKEL